MADTPVIRVGGTDYNVKDSTARADIATLQTTVAGHTTSIGGLQTDVGNLQTAVTGLGTSLQSTKTELQGNIDNLEEEIIRDYQTSPNLFDKDAAVRGKTIDLYYGRLVTLDTYTVSDFIPVTAGKTYNRTHACFAAFYDADKQFISADTDTTKTTLTIPSGAAFVRVNPSSNVVDAFMFCLNNTNMAKYYPYQKYYVQKQVKVGKEGTTIVDVAYGRNLFNKNTVLNQITINPTSGVWQAVSGYCTSDFMPVIPGQLIKKSAPCYNIFFDSNKDYLTGDADFSQTTVTVPEHAQYMRVCPPISSIGTFMVVVGNIDLTNYIPYAEYTLNEDIKVDGNNVIDTKVNNKLNVLVLGDSFSAGGGWIQKTAAKIGFKSLVNLGVGGATMKDKYNNRTTYPYTSRPPQDGSGNYNTFSSQIEKLKRLMAGVDLDTGETQLYTSASDYPDLIMIQGGTNDVVDTAEQEAAYQQQFFKAVTAYGKVGQSGEVTERVCTVPTSLDEIDRTSFGGAVRYLFSTLHEMFPNARFLFIANGATVLNNGSYYQPFYTKGLQIEHACNYIAIPVVNWSKCGRISYMTETITGSGTENDPYVLDLPGQYTTDTLHPNTAGCEMLAIPVITAIKEAFMYY